VTLRRDPAWPRMLQRRPLRSSTWTPPGAVLARADPDLRLAITRTSVATDQAHPEITGKDRDLPAARFMHADFSDGWAEASWIVSARSSAEGCPRGSWDAGTGSPAPPGPVTPG
jgi:hypothetical protein